MTNVLALLAALGFSGAAVASRRGVVHTSVIAGFGVSLAAGSVISVLIAVVYLPSPFPWEAVPVFVLAGLLGSTLGRLFVIAGVGRLGATVHVPVQSAVQPLVGLLGGRLLFAESVGSGRWMGAVGIVAGVWFVSRDSSASTGLGLGERVGGMARFWPLLIPVCGGLAFGASDLVAKEAMSRLPSPVFGAAVGTVGSATAWVGLIAVSPRLRGQLVEVGRGTGWFVLHGVLAAVASLAYFEAVGRGEVSVVTPILASQPLWVLLLSALALRTIERIRRSQIIGCGLVTLGTWLIIGS